MKAPWQGKKKMAVYLRRSQGETGSTKDQLKRIEDDIAGLEKAGKVSKINRSIVGRDIDKDIRFNAERDLALKGDIYNEGEGASGFDAEGRVVLNELIRRVRDGQYDGILVESMDRVSRDWTDFVSTVPAPLWREEGKVVYSLGDGEYLSDDPTEEAVINTRMTWGGIAKKGEIKKAKKALDTKIEKGFIQAKLKAEFEGSGTKSAGADYRQLWDMMQAYGTDSRGRLRGAGDISKFFKKDRTWAGRRFKMLSNWHEVTLPDGRNALETWLDSVDKINLFIKEQPFQYTKSAFKSEPVQRVLKAFNGFINYPAGVNPSPNYPVSSRFFINFPVPMDFDFDEIAAVDDPRTISGFEVQSTADFDVNELNENQLMIRAQEEATRKNRRGF